MNATRVASTLAFAALLGAALFSPSTTSFAQAPPSSSIPCGANVECNACRAAGFRDATPRSELSHRAWVEARERYEMLGADEGHDHAFNLLVANRDRADVICNVSRGTCSGRDEGCTLGLGRCSGKNGAPTCKVGESCTGEWSARVTGDWVAKAAPAEARAASFRPVDCDCLSSHTGREGFVRVVFRDGRQITDERQSIQQNLAGNAVGGPGTIVSKELTARAGEETAIACRNLNGALLGTIPAATPSPTTTAPPTAPPPPAAPPKVLTCPAPEPHYRVLGGRCVPSCGAAGGNTCNDAAACRGKPNLEAYDCAICCARGAAPSPPPARPPDALTCPAPEPHYRVVGGRCVPSCGAAGGNACNEAAACRGKPNLEAYDCAICCAR